MFSADLSWTPVVEVGPKRRDSSASRPPSVAGTERTTDLWEAQSPVTLGNSVSVTSSASSRKLSVFRWSKGKRTGTSSSNAGSIRRRTSISVAEMPEDRGPERHELPAASQSSPPPRRPSASSPTSSMFPSHAFPLANSRFDFAPRYQSPTSTHPSEGVASAPGRYQQVRDIKTPDNERSSDNWAGNWRPPEESASSSRGSAITDYAESSPRTTMLSQSRPSSSVLDGLSPPPKSPARPKPPSNLADAWPSLPTSSVHQPSDGLPALIRRMPSTSLTTRSHRATEEWVEPLEPHDRREISFEKELWLLTELSLRDSALPGSGTPVRTSAGPTLPIHAVQRSSRILDVCSRPAELLHLAALQPGARIAHLAESTEEGTQQRPLPHNVAGLSLAMAPGVSFPLGDASFDHARVTPAGVGAFSAPQLKGLLRECQRVLAVRGMLELRLVDPTPVEMGPNTARWVESELLVALESEFKCTRPAVMVPLWAREAGLELMEADGFGLHEFRVCVGEGATAAERLEVEVGQLLLRSQFPCVKSWLWEMDTCKAECLERATRFRVTTVFGLKA